MAKTEHPPGQQEGKSAMIDAPHGPTEASQKVSKDIPGHLGPVICASSKEVDRTSQKAAR